MTLGQIKPLIDAIQDHKCTTCGSVPIHFVDQGSNDPSSGILTFNYVSAPTCDRNCIRGIGSPNSGNSPSSQAPTQPSQTPSQQQPNPQPSVAPQTSQPNIHPPFPTPSNADPGTVNQVQTPSSVPSDTFGSSGGGAGRSDDHTGSSADSGGGGGDTSTTPIQTSVVLQTSAPSTPDTATAQALNMDTQQTVTVTDQGSAASGTQVSDQGGSDGSSAAAGSTVTVAPGSSITAGGAGAVTVTGSGGSAATPSGNAGVSQQRATASASPSSGLGVPGIVRMTDSAWVWFIVPLAALL